MATDRLAGPFWGRSTSDDDNFKAPPGWSDKLRIAGENIVVAPVEMNSIRDRDRYGDLAHRAQGWADDMEERLASAQEQLKAFYTQKCGFPGGKRDGTSMEKPAAATNVKKGAASMKKVKPAGGRKNAVCPAKAKGAAAKKVAAAAAKTKVSKAKAAGKKTAGGKREGGKRSGKDHAGNNDTHADANNINAGDSGDSPAVPQVVVDPLLAVAGCAVFYGEILKREKQVTEFYRDINGGYWGVNARKRGKEAWEELLQKPELLRDQDVQCWLWTMSVAARCMTGGGFGGFEDRDSNDALYCDSSDAGRDKTFCPPPAYRRVKRMIPVALQTGRVWWEVELRLRMQHAELYGDDCAVRYLVEMLEEGKMLVSMEELEELCDKIFGAARRYRWVGALLSWACVEETRRSENGDENQNDHTGDMNADSSGSRSSSRRNASIVADPTPSSLARTKIEDFLQDPTLSQIQKQRVALRSLRAAPRLWNKAFYKEMRRTGANIFSNEVLEVLSAYLSLAQKFLEVLRPVDVVLHRNLRVRFRKRIVKFATAMWELRGILENGPDLAHQFFDLVFCEDTFGGYKDAENDEEDKELRMLFPSDDDDGESHPSDSDASEGSCAESEFSESPTSGPKRSDLLDSGPRKRKPLLLNNDSVDSDDSDSGEDGGGGVSGCSCAQFRRT